jgi:transcriptional regulator with XRE-family HTH domain
MRKGQGRYENWVREGFPGWLQERLEDRNWSISDLERQSGIKVTIISRWMTGRQVPNPEHVVRVARALSVRETEALRAAGFLTEDPITDDPRRMEIQRRVAHLELTHERYLALNALLVSMEAAAAVRLRADRPGPVEEVLLTPHPAADAPHPDGQQPQSALETAAPLTGCSPTSR